MWRERMTEEEDRTPTWEVCREALIRLGARTKWASVPEIVDSVRSIAGKEHTDRELIEYALLLHSAYMPLRFIVNTIPGVPAPPQFETDGQGNFRLVPAVTTRIAERDLQEFLARDLNRLIPALGLTLELFATENKSGKEFRIEKGSIDILAVSDSGTFYVLELKSETVDIDVLKNVTKYRMWVEENLTNGKSAEVVLVAPEFTKELKYQVRKHTPPIWLIRWTLNFDFENVTYEV